MNTQTLQACTESFKNTHWLVTTEEIKTVCILKSEPYDTLEKRLIEAIEQHKCEEDISINSIAEHCDQLHEIEISVPIDTDNSYEEVLNLEPVWEY